MFRTRRWVAAAVAISSLLAASGVAEAQRTSAVMVEFEGRRGRALTNSVARVIEDDVSLRDASESRAAARRLRARLDSPQGISAVARDLGVDLVVTGEVSGSRRRPRLAITIYDADGNELSSGSTVVPRGRRGARNVQRTAARAIREAVSTIEDRRRREMQQQEAEIEERDQEILAGGGIDDEDPRDDDDDDGDGGPDARPDVPFLVAYIGIGGRTRSASVNIITTQPGGITREAVRQYQVGLFPELSARLELRPFKSDPGIVGGLYAQFDLAKSLGLESQDEDGSIIETDAFRFMGQVGLMLEAADGIEVGPLLGFGWDSFTLGENMVMPSADYGFMRIGVVGRIGVLDENLLYLQPEVGYRLLLGVGDLGTAFGTEASGGFSWDLGVAAGGGLDIGLVYALRLALTQYNFSFTGAGTEAAGTDGDDFGFSFAVQAGWALR